MESIRFYAARVVFNLFINYCPLLMNYAVML